MAMPVLQQVTPAPPVQTVQTCPLCGAAQFTALFATKDCLQRLPGEFGLLRCDSCTLVILSPRPLPEQIGYYYPEEEYYSYQAEFTLNEPAHQRSLSQRVRDNIRHSVLASLGYPVPAFGVTARVFQPLLARLFGKRAIYSQSYFPRYVPGGRALEIGCGSGVYLACLKKHGWQVTGVELSAKAAQIAFEKWRIEVHTGPLQATTFAPESFDFIYLGDVIEHLPDPPGTLKLLARFLKPGGTLFLRTPNVDSFGFRYWQGYWLGCDSPRHLYLFSPATLGRAIETAGLRVTRQRTLPLLPGNYVAEFTYGFEATQPTAQRAPRFQFQPGERWPARKLVLQAYWHWLWNRLNGEVLECWATKAAL